MIVQLRLVEDTTGIDRDNESEAAEPRLRLRRLAVL
jgi:hypothetical protein